jgi:hypothetical protein
MPSASLAHPDLGDGKLAADEPKPMRAVRMVDFCGGTFVFCFRPPGEFARRSCQAPGRWC